MKKRILSTLTVMLVLLLTSCVLFSCGGGDGGDNTTPSGNQPTKLNAPVVTLSGNAASWEANTNADKFEISFDGNLSYVENTITSRTL